MSTAVNPFVKPAPAGPGADVPDHLDHIACCSDTKGMCGVDLTGSEEIDAPDFPRLCVVCLQLDMAGACPDCGT